MTAPAKVQSGPFEGHPIRTARKAGKCADFRHCGVMIQLGDRYVEGDVDPYKAGGFGHERLCLACAHVSGDDALSREAPDNAHLIDAAPDLYSALAGVSWKSADRDNMEFAATITYSRMDAIRKALAKARGEQP